MADRILHIGKQEFRVTAVSSGLGRWIALVDHYDHSTHPVATRSGRIEAEFGTIAETLDAGVRVCMDIVKRQRLP